MLGLAMLLDPLLSLCLPPRCLVCGRGRDAWLCLACRRAAAVPSPAACPRCDHALAGSETCPDCLRAPPAYVQARALGRHEGVLREAVLRLKYYGAWRLADPLGALMAERARAVWSCMEFDAVVPVPLEASREAARGYNQAALLASCMAVRLGLPHRPRWLLRRATGRKQHALAVDARERHAAAAFEAAPAAVLEGARLLVVDDVMTSGATLNACCAALAARGARSWAIVAARGTMRARSSERKRIA